MSPALAKPVMIEVERTFDPKVVRAVLAHPTVYYRASDDGRPYVRDYVPEMHPEVWNFAVHADGRLVGLIGFIPLNCVTCQAHVSMLPEGLGFAVPAGQLAIQSIWRHTGCRRIEARVPSFNRLALRVAQQVGMIEFGETGPSYLHGGRMWTEVMLAINKPTEVKG